MVTSRVKNVFFRLESVPAHLRWTARSAHRRSETEPVGHGQHGKHQSPVSGTVMKMSLRGIFIYCHTATLIWCGPIPSLKLWLFFVGNVNITEPTNKSLTRLLNQVPGFQGSTTPRPDWNPTITAGISAWGEPWSRAWSPLHGACISVSPSLTMSPGKIWKWPCRGMLLGMSKQVDSGTSNIQKSMLLLGLWAVSIRFVSPIPIFNELVYGKYRKFKAPWGRR